MIITFPVKTVYHNTVYVMKDPNCKKADYEKVLVKDIWLKFKHDTKDVQTVNTSKVENNVEHRVISLKIAMFVLRS